SRQGPQGQAARERRDRPQGHRAGACGECGGEGEDRGGGRHARTAGELREMANPIPNLWRIPELKNKLLFTLGVLLLYRVGAHITTPGINYEALQAQFGALQGTLLGVYDMFVGGALSRATVFALGIMPYIPASIMFQLLAAVFPTIEKMQKEGEDGRKKLTQWTRYATIGLALMQAYGYAIFLQSLGAGVVVRPGIGFIMTTAMIMTFGAVFVMWLGEQITERGIGNGMSLLIFFSIIE